jgi:GNAT superfamily N-acetyltransferase
MTIRIAPLTGKDVAKGIDAAARLRIAVFRDWPYLYDGSMDYEASYLAKFAKAKGAIIVAAYDGDSIVGCASAAPLAEVEADFSAPFRERGWDIARIFYCGESVLLPAYRGRGIGNAFFDQREAQAASLGSFSHSVFCAVVRPEDHPLRPKSYVPLEAFWRKRGYEKTDGLTTYFTWKDVDQPEQTAKLMQFWIKAL